jgi:hypothetical protein
VALDSFQAQTLQTKEACIKALSVTYTNKEFDKAAQHAIHLTYLYKLEQEIRDKKRHLRVVKREQI